MTLLHKAVGNAPYLMQDGSEDVRPQLISRHSSSLPVNNRNDTKKKALSRRSRSASPCVKKTYSGHTSNSSSQPHGMLRGLTPNSPQLPIIKKLNSGKSLRAARTSSSGTKQRSQILNEHKKSLRICSVMERIVTAKDGTTSRTADVNSNFSFNGDEMLGYDKTVTKHSYPHSPMVPLRELTTRDNIELARQAEPTVCHSPFDMLPPECKQRIFSYLNQLERGRCMFVSREWYHLVHSPHLWKIVNLREFRLCYGHDMPDQMCTKQCYARYMNRIDRYVLSLIDIKPRVRRVELSFDYATSNWLDTVNRLFRHLNLEELEYVDINWHDTPSKPVWLLPGQEYTFRDIAFAIRRRQRLFLDFLGEFVSEMPNLKTLIIPFHWSLRAMRCITSLGNLRNLILKKYTVYRTPEQEALNELANMASLERLLIEVWLPTACTERYHLSSPTLTYLDLSQCRGFYLQYVDLPALEVLKVDLNIGGSQNSHDLPRLCNMLHHGAPKLKRINQINLTALTPMNLHRVFRSLCPSTNHLD